MSFIKTLLLLTTCLLFTGLNAAEPPVRTLRISVLSTMLTGGKGVGEWGFSALVEVDGRRLLFDTGNLPSTVLENARALGHDLSDITDVVLSHHHVDHVGGLLTLRRVHAGKNPDALARVHVVRGSVWSRGPGPYEGDENPLISIRPAYEASGGVFVEHTGPVELLPGVWLTGPIPRVHAEQGPVGEDHVHLPDGAFVPDPVPEDSALVFDTPKGLVVLTGCAHAGLINTLEYARVITGRPDAAIHAATGGFHLHRASDGSLDWTTEKLRALDLKHLHGGHCTGLETVYRLRRDLGLPREAATVAAVGSWFDLEKGIHPLAIAR
jgi:7,8-dihydropterin-6-yl-methyl-4-(beta-D-ribofuranosyl)aminobenzene 5'-phosphate synthase